MAKKKPPSGPPTVSETIRGEIMRRGGTAYAIARQSGVDTSVITRFMAGERGLSMKTLDRLCVSLELELRPSPRASEAAPE
jgi:plasmid maintenance system antidote protein VapI